MPDPFRFFVGIDLGSQAHQVYVIDAAGQSLGQRAVAHSGSDLGQFFTWLSQLLGVPAEQVAVAAEAPHGAMVEACLERGYAVFSVNPKQLDRFRDRFSVAGAKDDRRDASVLAHSLRTDRHCFRPLDLDDPRLLRLRELSRAQDRLGQDFRRSANQLWQFLQRYFPALLTLVPAADERWLRALLQIAPLPASAARLRSAPLKRLLKQHHIRRLTAAQLRDVLRQPALPLAPGVAEAVAEQVVLLLPRLRLLHQQQAQLSRRIEQLIEELAADSNFRDHRDVQILRSVPGVGRVFTATVLAEATRALAQRDYHAFRALAGVARVTSQAAKLSWCACAGLVFSVCAMRSFTLPPSTPSVTLAPTSTMPGSANADTPGAGLSGALPIGSWLLSLSCFKPSSPTIPHGASAELHSLDATHIAPAAPQAAHRANLTRQQNRWYAYLYLPLTNGGESHIHRSTQTDVGLSAQLSRFKTNDRVTRPRKSR